MLRLRHLPWFVPLVVILAVLLLYFLTAPPPIEVAFDQIQPGMTEQEVYAIVARYSPSFRVEQSHLSSWGGLRWTDGRKEVTVYFGPDDLVSKKEICEGGWPPPLSWEEQLQHHLRQLGF